jgi:purine nucleosidase
MAGLDVTHQALATAEVTDRMRALGRLGGELLLPSLRGYQSLADAAGQPVHDVCALALVAAPGLFGCRPAHVEVETQGRWTSGMTVTDFGAETHNALVAMSVDAAGFWDLVLGAMHRSAAAMDAG